LEAVLVACAAAWVVRFGFGPGLWAPIRDVAVDNPWGLALVGALWTVLAALSLSSPPAFLQWESLWPVLDLERSGGIGSVAGWPGGINHAVLPHLMLRHRISWGIGVFGFLGYVIIGFSSYALARRYAWPPTAFAVTLVVLSAPRLLYHAVTPGMEILPAAAAVFSLLALFRTVEQPNPADLLLMLPAMAFAVTAGPLGYVVPLVLAGLAVVVLYRRHGGRIWLSLFREHPFWLLGSLAAVAVFSQPGLWAGAGPAPFPSPEAAPANPSGIVGGGANLVRYALEALSPTAALDRLLDAWWGLPLSSVLERGYHRFLSPVFGSAGSAAPFAVSWSETPALAWFGPQGMLLMVPAMVVAMVRGPRRLKSVAVAMAGYLYLAALIPAWVPGNGRLFTPFAACSGCMMAYMLPPWRLTRTGKRVLQLACALLMAYGCWQMVRLGWG
jgi:hypothetical protein